MASESAFNKRLTAETTFDKVEGLLEHFNLPPKAISFIRGNLRIIQIGIAVIVTAIVFTSLYSSYQGKRKEEASSALAKAMQQSKEGQAEALRKVSEEYGSTSSALWAKIEIAHLDMQNGAYSEAGEKYRKILEKTDVAKPLYPLVLFSLAQALEVDKKFLEATKEYDRLKGFKGYEHIAYSGMGRLEEVQGNIEKAIAIYNNFLLSIGDDPSFAQSKEQIDGRIARLKARL
ncbi:MAG: tetratricopeptide repeat protein [Proteobacteria bacterium]|nr:tetratricopeptide repeat protein [Pseudomonadota bacterium]